MNKQQRQPLDLGQHSGDGTPEISKPVKLIGWIIGGICAVGILFIIMMIIAALGA